MWYAIVDDVARRYGADVLAQWSVDGQPNTAFIEQTLRDACSFIDSFLGQRVITPVPPCDLLERLAVDIAVYWLAIDAGLETDAKRRRFEDAKDWLQRFSRGELGLDTSIAAEQGDSEGAHFSAQPRCMSRARLVGF